MEHTTAVFRKYMQQFPENTKYKGSLFQTISSEHGLSKEPRAVSYSGQGKNILDGTFFNLNQYFDEQFEIYGDNEGSQIALYGR